MQKAKVVHVLNQFFGGIGGEDQADTSPFVKAGPVGPGNLLQQLLQGEAEILATLIAGDNFVAEDVERALAQGLRLLEPLDPDLVIAGPAFNSGRYGIACGAICRAVQERFRIPVLTGMHAANPAVPLYAKDVYILETAASAAGMKEAITNMAAFALKLLKGSEPGPPDAEGYFPRGIRRNIFVDRLGADRAVELLLKKLKGEPFHTELPLPAVETIPPAPPIRDLSTATIVLVTEGGIVPKENPDRIEPSMATRFGRYRIADVEDLTPVDFAVSHGGYDNRFASEDPDRVLPLDAAKALEREAVFGRLHPYYYVTAGNATAVDRARRFAQEILGDLKEIEGEVGILLTST